MAGVDTGTNTRIEALTAGPRDAQRLSHLNGRRAHDDLPFGHKCGARWSGMQTSHCARCHQTFGGVGGFDRHRKDGKCLVPVDIGMSLLPGRAFAVWGMPHTEPSE